MRPTSPCGASALGGRARGLLPPAAGLGAQLHDAADRAGPGATPARSRRRWTRRASATSCRTTAPRSRSRRARPRRRGSRSPSAGLPSTARSRASRLIDKQKLGTSDFQQQVNYQRALEGELAKTIDGVRRLRRRARAARAARQEPALRRRVEARRPPRSCSAGTTHSTPRGARHRQLVAGAVPGLQDRRGHDHRRLRPPAVARRATAATTRRVDRQDAAEARYDATIAASSPRCSTRTLGPGKAQVTGRRRPRRQPGDAGAAHLRQEGRAAEADEANRDAQGRRGGRCGGGQAGVTGNVAQGARTNGAGTASGSNYRKNDTSTDYGVDKVVERRTVAPGTVNRMDVAVLVDSASKPNLPAIRNALSSAAGIQAARGDTLSVQAVAFAKPPRPRSQRQARSRRRGELRQVRRPGPRRPALPLLRHPGHPQARVLLARRADLAVGDLVAALGRRAR